MDADAYDDVLLVQKVDGVPSARNTGIRLFLGHTQRGGSATVACTPIRELLLAKYRYYFASGDVFFEVTGGQFWFGEEG